MSHRVTIRLRDLYEHQRNMIKVIRYFKNNDVEFTFRDGNYRGLNLSGDEYAKIKFPKAIVVNEKIGSGKTLIALKSLSKKTLNVVIVPVHLHKQWGEEIEKFMNPKRFIIVNYWKDIKLIEQNDKLTYIIRSTMVSALHTHLYNKNINLDTLIIDEISNHTKVNNCDLRDIIRNKIKFLLVLSGDNFEDECENSLGVPDDSIFTDRGKYKNGYKKIGSNIPKISHEYKKYFIYNSSGLTTPIELIPKEVINDIFREKDMHIKLVNIIYPVFKSDVDVFNFMDITENIISCEINENIMKTINKYNDLMNKTVIENINCSAAIQTPEDLIKALIKYYERKLTENLLVNTIEEYVKKISRLEQLLTEKNCPICLDTIENPVILECCEKMVCSECLKSWANTERYASKKCPFCRQPYKGKLVDIKEINKSMEQKKNMPESSNAPLENIKRKMDILKHIFNRNPHEKFILFSDDNECFQFMKGGVPNSKILNGKISRSIINDFNNPEGETRILMINSKSKQTGLNLVGASTVIFYHEIDPIRKKQAVGRAIRINRNTPLEIIYLYNSGIENISSVSENPNYYGSYAEYFHQNVEEE